MAGRPSRAPEQRQRVLAACVGIFSRRGYRGTSMNEIAAEVGLSKPTLYHYFRSKEDILVRLYEDVMEQSLSSAHQIMAAAEDPFEGLRQLIAYRVRYTCENQAIHKVFFEEEDELPPELLRTVLDQRREFEDVLKVAVTEHLTRTGQELPTSTTLFVNACLGAANWVYKWYDPAGSEDPTTLGDHMATLVLQPLQSNTPATRA
ncbi:MAG TPA: TetR/AcrR family transcriptional regulator [Pseudonocardiaceae bacterium]|jgi:TetR/AcrR family transcriptional regulator|nr:TetR/AcrR family transcriptional regulator [Pseudonocardiaceae bacterium]